VRIVYGAQFADAGVALRLILPGIVAYSVVAVLSRYITGRGRPGTGTLILVAGLALNIGANLFLIPAYGSAAPRRRRRCRTS
jgi:O-antigen/teichoic acid export membrane protein